MSNVNEILTYLSAFDPLEIKVALEQFNKRSRAAKEEGEWKIWTEGGTPPRPYEWRKINNTTYYREPLAHPRLAASYQAAREGKTAKKTETSVRPNPGMSCPYCKAETFLEPVCPGCREGRAGMVARIICGENADHIFYIPKGEE